MFNVWRDCLGFAPRSESFAFEPSVQVSSISSLSGLTSCRPSANPLERAGTSFLARQILAQTKIIEDGKNPSSIIYARRDCLDLFALNVPTCFDYGNTFLVKSTPHSAHRSLERIKRSNLFTNINLKGLVYTSPFKFTPELTSLEHGYLIM